MLVYFIKRLLMLIPVLFCVSILVFLIMRVFSPDPALIVLGQHATTEKINMWRESMGLNDPIVIQYLDYMKAVFHGDFGYSYFTNTPVTDELLARLPATIELSVLAIILAAIIGIFLGVLSAVKKNSIIDNLTIDFSPHRCFNAGILARNAPYHSFFRISALVSIRRTH